MGTDMKNSIENAQTNSFRPAKSVHLDSETLQKIAEEGLRFRREIEKRTASMTCPSGVSESKSRLR